MEIHSNLLHQIPVPKQTLQKKNNTPLVATIKVGDVEEGERVYFDEPVVKNSFLNNIFVKIKQNYLKKRIEKLESIPENKRTPVQQAEIEANRLSGEIL